MMSQPLFPGSIGFVKGWTYILMWLCLVATYDLGDFEAVIEAISSGKMKPEGMITKKVAMDKVAEEGFKTLIEDKDNHVKVLVDMTQAVA